MRMEISAEFINRAPARTAYQLGQAIVARRRELGVSQQELAVALDVHRPQLSNLENGDATLQMRLLFEALAELGLEIMVRVKP